MLRRLARSTAIALLLAQPALAQQQIPPNLINEPLLLPPLSAGNPLIGSTTGGITQGTRSGNTTEFGTVSGALTSGHIAKFDANGNIVDGGSGGGGGACPSLEQFGGAGDNSTDNTAPLANLIAAGASNIAGICIQEGSGKFVMTGSGGTTYTFPAGSNPYSFSLSGAGANNTIFYWPTAAQGLVFNFKNALQTVHFDGFTLSTGTVGATGKALALLNTNPPSGADWSTIRDVTVRGDDFLTKYWATGIEINGVSFVNMSGLHILGDGTHGTGLEIQGNSGGSFHFAIGFNVTQSNFERNNIGINLPTLWQTLVVSDSFFLNGNLGIDYPAGGAAGADQLTVSNTLFNEAAGTSISLSTEVGTTQLVNDYFLIPTGQNGFACLLCGGTQIIGSRFQALNTPGSGAAILIGSQTAGVPGILVTGDQFWNLAAGVIFSAGGSGFGSVQSNMYVGNTNDTSPSATTGSVTIGGGSK